MSENKLDVRGAIEKLNSSNVEERKLAVNSLEGVNDKNIIAPLIEALKDENHPVRFKAAENLGAMGEIAIGDLINAVNNGEGEFKRFASFALKQTGSEKAVDYFVEALNDEDFGVRKVAVRSLGELNAVNKLDDIASTLEDEDWGVRLAAIRSLGDLGTEEAITAIKKARRKEKDKDFKKACNKAIKKIEKAIK
ncbi:MAG: HEAT repeat domain-containing protein [Methanobacteriaceae archaeon]